MDRRCLKILMMVLALVAAPLVMAADQPAHYDVDARFDPISGYLHAEVVVTLPPQELADPAFLFGNRFQITSVDAGADSQMRTEPTDKPIRGLQLVTLQFKRTPTRPVKIRFRYQGPINAPEADPAFTPDSVELRLEEFWLPVRRDLGLFYSVRAKITGLPKGVTAVAQNKFRQRGSTLTIDRTTADNDLPVSGLAGMVKQASEQVEFYSAIPHDPLVAHIRKHAEAAAEFHRQRFGALQEPLRVIAMPRATAGGYARRHMIVMPTFPKGAPTPAFDQSSPAAFIAHEVNHAWLPSPRGGGENHWVAESIAEYVALRYIEAAFGEAEQRSMLTRKVRTAVDAGSMLTSDRPGRPALYQKGPLLLFRLERRIGREQLERILFRPDRPRSTDEFLAALKTVAGADIANEFRQTMAEAGLPADLIEPVKYSVVMSGAIKGELSVLFVAGRERRTSLRFDDRGRGPDLRTTSRYDERGWLSSYQLEGLNYAKRPIAENFAIKDGTARWSSGADSGAAAANGFYLPSGANAEDMAALARALLQAKDELALLPAGRARIEKKQELSVNGAAGPAKATLYLISGIDLQPAALWLDTDLELFATASTWQSLVKAGYEDALPQLIAAQDQALSADTKAQARAMRRQPGGPVLIRNARLFDAEKRVMRANVSVLIRGDRIVAVAPALPIPGDAEIIDAQGKTLLPGLWEMHAHILGESEGVTSLLAGVTTSRDLGNNADALQRISQQFDDGSLTGPWVLKAGLIDGRGPYAAPIGVLVGTPDEMRAAVNAVADRGYPQVKFYSSLTRELLDVGIQTARSRDLRISGHVPAGMTLREAILAGFDEVQHANFLFLNFMPPAVVNATNTPVRFSAVLEHGHELDLASSKVQELIALMKKRGTAVDPTLVTFENMFTGYKGELARWMAPWVDRLPAASARSGRSGGRASTPEERAIYSQSFTRMKQLIKKLHTAGVPIVAGTDGGALLYARELELYVEAGISPADVLYIATLGAARIMKQDAEVGSITPGKRADLILIDGDPLARIGDVRNTRLVMKGGVIYDSDALSKAAGLAPKTK